MRRGKGPCFLLRPSAPADLPRLLALARHIDSTNLPADRGALGSLIARSRRSFAGREQDRARAVYLFVADAGGGRLAGASLVIAKHGTPESPHYYLELVEEERYSVSLRRMFRHTCLCLRRSLDGPSEVGGLIVHPSYRGRPGGLGRQLSYVRFLYMAAHPERFESRVIAEFMPVLVGGKSPLWESFGRRVTGLDFRDADRLSRGDKEFIHALFPDAPIYTRLLPVRVQRLLGRPAREAEPAIHLLEKAGLRFLGQIDPFDGAPYYGAPLAEVRPFRAFRRYRVSERGPAPPAEAPTLLVAAERRGFRAIGAVAAPAGGGLGLGREERAALGVEVGDEVAAIPLRYC